MNNEFKKFVAGVGGNAAACQKLELSTSMVIKMKAGIRNVRPDTLWKILQIDPAMDLYKMVFFKYIQTPETPCELRLCKSGDPGTIRVDECIGDRAFSTIICTQCADKIGITENDVLPSNPVVKKALTAT